MRPHHFLEAPCQRYPLGQLVVAGAGPLPFHMLFLVPTLHTACPLSPGPERCSTTQVMSQSFDPSCEVSVIRVCVRVHFSQIWLCFLLFICLLPLILLRDLPEPPLSLSHLPLP